MNQRKALVALSVLAVLFAVIFRLVDHPANFAPIGAIALVSAYYLHSKGSWAIPLGAMLLSDAIIGFYSLPVMLSVYASYLAIWALGRWAKQADTKSALLPAVLFGSITHFVATNFAVWAFTGLYAKTLSGLAFSYTMAIPFFKWTLAGDLFFAGVFIAMIEGARQFSKSVVSKEAVESQIMYHQS